MLDLLQFATTNARAEFGGGSQRTFMSEHLFIIYDERAMTEGTDEAAVLCTARSLKEARRDVRTMFARGVIFQYDVRGDELVNETFIEMPALAVKA